MDRLLRAPLCQEGTFSLLPQASHFEQVNFASFPKGKLKKEFRFLKDAGMDLLEGLLICDPAKVTLPSLLHIFLLLDLLVNTLSHPYSGRVQPQL
jgi:hypothetical protein